MKIATWNVNSLRARIERVQEFLEIKDPDILCLQETKISSDIDQDFINIIQTYGYKANFHGNGQWNGVAIISKSEQTNVIKGFSGDPKDPGVDRNDCRLIRATIDNFRIYSVYVPNGREVDSDHYVFKLYWLDRLKADLESEVGAQQQIVLGDFNIAPRDSDVFDISAFKGMTHVSQKERDALAAIEACGFVDLGGIWESNGSFTWWDYRQGAFHKNHGMRIDLCLSTSVVAKLMGAVSVERDFRKGSKPSDHAPVMIEF